MLKPEAHRIEVPGCDCGETSVHMLRDLIGKNTVACRYCGSPIDISDVDRQAVFRKALDDYRQIYKR